MEEKLLFLKYNKTYTKGMKKNNVLSQELKNNGHKIPLKKHTKILLLLHASYNCNLSCVYCENGSLRERYCNSVMSEQMIRDVVRKLGGVLSEITWHGGEPLVLPESFFEALEDEKKKCGYDFPTTLQTNSVLLTDEKIEFLNKLNIGWGTSFDGCTNTQTRGQKSTDAIMSLRERYPEKFGYISVTIKDTIDNLILNYEYAKLLGDTGLQCCIVRENVIENGNAYLINNDIAVDKMLEYIDYWIHDTNNPVLDSYVIRQVGRLIGESKTCEEIDCTGGWLMIDPYGNIGFCGHSQLDDGIININDINDYTDILSHKKYLSTLYKQKKLIQKCQPCEYYDVCYGGCMGINYECDHTYNTINPRNCDYTKRLLDGIYELIKDIDINDEQYNPLFIQMLKDNCYYSLTEIKEIEGEN